MSDDGLTREICALWRHHALAGDEHGRREGLFADEFGERAAERRETREPLTGALQRSRLDAVEPALQTFLHLLGVDLRGDQSRYRGLLYRFLQTVTDASTNLINCLSCALPRSVRTFIASSGATRICDSAARQT